MKPMRWTPALVLALTLVAGNAIAEDSAGQQRARIAAQRDAVQKRFIAEERECEQRFIVTSCVNVAQKERRDALAPLRQEELRIDTIERQQRAADRLEEIEAKQRADAAKDAASTPESNRVPGAAARAPNRPASAGLITGLAPRPAISDAERQRRESDAEARFDAKQADAQKRRDAAAARNAKRAASGKMAKPLPVPDGASAP